MKALSCLVRYGAIWHPPDRYVHAKISIRPYMHNARHIHVYICKSPCFYGYARVTTVSRRVVKRCASAFRCLSARSLRKDVMLDPLTSPFQEEWHNQRWISADPLVLQSVLACLPYLSVYCLLVRSPFSPQNRITVQMCLRPCVCVRMCRRTRFYPPGCCRGDVRRAQVEVMLGPT